jgi:hypothetical protein
MLEGIPGKEPGKIARSSRSTDIYAFGILAWELFMGRHRTSQFEKPDVHLLPLHVDPRIKEMLQKCCDHNRDNRPSAIHCFSVLENVFLERQKNEFEIFLSHSWKDKSFVSYIRHYLMKLGYRIWYDSDNMEHHLKESMSSSIAKSKIFVVCLDSFYVASDNCLFELKEAVKAKKIIITLLLESPTSVDGEPSSWLTPEIEALCRCKSHLYLHFYSVKSNYEWKELNNDAPSVSPSSPVSVTNNNSDDEQRLQDLLQSLLGLFNLLRQYGLFPKVNVIHGYTDHVSKLLQMFLFDDVGECDDITKSNLMTTDCMMDEITYKEFLTSALRYINSKFGEKELFLDDKNTQEVQWGEDSLPFKETQIKFWIKYLYHMSHMLFSNNPEICNQTTNFILTLSLKLVMKNDSIFLWKYKQLLKESISLDNTDIVEVSKSADDNKLLSFTSCFLEFSGQTFAPFKEEKEEPDALQSNLSLTLPDCSTEEILKITDELKTFHRFLVWDHSCDYLINQMKSQLLELNLLPTLNFDGAVKLYKETSAQSQLNLELLFLLMNTKMEKAQDETQSHQQEQQLTQQSAQSTFFEFGDLFMKNLEIEGEGFSIPAKLNVGFMLLLLPNVVVGQESPDSKDKWRNFWINLTNFCSSSYENRQLLLSQSMIHRTCLIEMLNTSPIPILDLFEDDAVEEIAQKVPVEFKGEFLKEDKQNVWNPFDMEIFPQRYIEHLKLFSLLRVKSITKLLKSGCWMNAEVMKIIISHLSSSVQELEASLCSSIGEALVFYMSYYEFQCSTNKSNTDNSEFHFIARDVLIPVFDILRKSTFEKLIYDGDTDLPILKHLHPFLLLIIHKRDILLIVAIFKFLSTFLSSSPDQAGKVGKCTEIGYCELFVTIVQEFGAPSDEKLEQTDLPPQSPENPFILEDRAALMGNVCLCIWNLSALSTKNNEFLVKTDFSKFLFMELILPKIYLDYPDTMASFYGCLWNLSVPKSIDSNQVVDTVLLSLEKYVSNSYVSDPITGFLAMYIDQNRYPDVVKPDLAKKGFFSILMKLIKKHSKSQKRVVKHILLLIDRLYWINEALQCYRESNLYSLLLDRIEYYLDNYRNSDSSEYLLAFVQTVTTISANEACRKSFAELNVWSSVVQGLNYYHESMCSKDNAPSIVEKEGEKTNEQLDQLGDSSEVAEEKKLSSASLSKRFSEVPFEFLCKLLQVIIKREEYKKLLIQEHHVLEKLADILKAVILDKKDETKEGSEKKKKRISLICDFIKDCY